MSRCIYIYTHTYISAPVPVTCAFLAATPRVQPIPCIVLGGSHHADSPRTLVPTNPMPRAPVPPLISQCQRPALSTGEPPTTQRPRRPPRPDTPQSPRASSSARCARGSITNWRLPRRPAVPDCSARRRSFLQPLPSPSPPPLTSTANWPTPAPLGASRALPPACGRPPFAPNGDAAIPHARPPGEPHREVRPSTTLY